MLYSQFLVLGGFVRRIGLAALGSIISVTSLFKLFEQRIG